MTIIKMPDGSVGVHMGTSAEAKVIQDTVTARGRIAKVICEEKGWPTDPTKLSWDQILELREDPRWKEPLDATLN